MTNKWMLGTAVAAVLAATPALAVEHQSEFGQCALAEMTNETFLGLDLDDDSGLTMDEYRGCLEEAGIELDEQQTADYEAAFTQADTDADGILIFAEVEAVQTASADPGAPRGTVTVKQPAAEVVVEQPAPEVVVQQPEPEVTVQQPKPQVEVQTPKPEVAVSTPEPTVEVQQGQPTVQVDQPAPTVQVQQPEPQVQVDAGQPAVQVETAQPNVNVEQPQPDVEVTQPELDVAVEQQQPDVAVRQGQADVAVQQTDQTQAGAQTTTEVAAVQPEATVGATPTTPIQIRIADYEGEDVFNAAGEKIGDIQAIVFDPAAQMPVVIVSVGGFLGIGDREVAFPFDQITVTGDNIVLDTTMSKDEIKQLPEYDTAKYEDLPAEYVVQ